MPPETPSPHRFLAGAPRQQSPEKKAAPRVVQKPAARPAVIDGTPKAPSSRYIEAPRSSQFAATPRFSVGFSKANVYADRSPSPPKSTLVQALRSTGRRTEEVEDVLYAGTEHDGELSGTHEQTQSLPTTEATSEHEQEWRHQLPYSPKRRRVGPGVDDDLSTAMMQPSARQHNAEPSVISSARSGPRFAHALASQADDNSHQSSLGHSRPSFLRPTGAALEPQEPLPDAFSPHRRGNKFVPGGMAAMLQQWVVETGQAAVQGRRGRGLPLGSDYTMKVQIKEVHGLAPLLVNAISQDNAKVRLLLITSPNSTEIMSGSIIGVRAPMWEINLSQEEWTVAVDWRALQ